jgi:hypothetical protein
MIRKSGHPFSVRDPAQHNNESAIAIKAIALPEKPPNQVSERKARNPTLYSGRNFHRPAASKQNLTL